MGKQVGRAPGLPESVFHALPVLQSSHKAPSWLHDPLDSNPEKVSTYRCR